MPSKRSINLVPQDENRVNPFSAIAGIVVILLVVGLLSKVFVVDRMMEVYRASARTVELRNSLTNTLASSRDFGDVEDKNPGYADISNRPDGVILSYPVITAGEYTHKDSIRALLGPDPSQEELDYYSLEKQVGEDTPPCFLWQTETDSLVPVENTYLFAMALRKKKVPFAHYVFPDGFHGLSVADKAFFRGWSVISAIMAVIFFLVFISHSARIATSVAWPWAPPSGWWIITSALGSARRLPFSPAISRKAPMLAAIPTHTVRTCGLIYFMVS